MMLLRSKFLTSTTSYLEPGVEMMLFQYSFEVVRLDVGVETSTSKVSLSPLTVSCTLCISFLWGPNAADDAAMCDLGVLGDFVLVDEKQVLVPCMSSIPWKIRPISFDTPFFHLSFWVP